MKNYTSFEKSESTKGRGGKEAFVIKQLGWVLAALWTLVVSVSFTWSYFNERDAARHAAVVSARAQFTKDVIYRRWNTGHGGVYVPISKSSPPNPYLTQVEEREIETPSGRRLTLINPAYMTRQVHELGWKTDVVRGHITSLNPIRPANAPDDWEKRVLTAFEGGERESFSVETLNNEAHLRLMRPLITETSCLKCHAQQGYREGDIRGGISVSIPMAPYMAISQKKMTAIGFGHCALWLLGMAGIGLGVRRIGRDINERYRAEESLRFTQFAIDHASDATFWMGQDARFIYVNEAACNTFGYSREELLTMTVHDIDPIFSEEVWSDHWADLKHRGTFLIESQYRTKDGRVFPAEIRVNFLKYGGNEYNCAFARDISERKQAEKALRESEEKLARSKKMESLGLLAGGVAHDLNNVLSGIVSYPELILMDLPGDSKLKKPIEIIMDSGNRAAAIVQDLLTIARGAATPKDPLNLNGLARDYLNSPELKNLKQFNPEVTIITDFERVLFNVSGSYVHIRKVLMNLVTNASEAIEGTGSVTILTENRYIDRPLSGYEDVIIGEYVVLTVTDDGPGIASDDLKKIFEPFYTKKVMGRSGTGLGLTVAWNVMQDHNGYIDVISGKTGTTFELYFPITRDEISGKDLSLSIEDYKGNQETILVVDDEERQREISCGMLDKLGYKTSAVSSGEEAVEYLKENSVDLLLLDMIMDPGINGLETYEKIITIHPGQKAVIVSGFADTDAVKKVQRIGAGQYIKKPVTLETIGLAVKRELEK